MSNSPIRCLISAGPTREYFDPVRFLSNPSSGKMGYALAEAAASLGWFVNLVSGPVALECPPGCLRTSVVTGQEMFDAVNGLFPECDILIMTAAVMDYRPVERSTAKIKKDQLSMNIEMEPTTDILKTVTQQKTRQMVVGFAAETNDVEAYALRKMEEKRCDFIVANQVGQPGQGFESDTNRVLLLGPDGLHKVIGPDSKRAIAAELVSFFNSKLRNS